MSTSSDLRRLQRRSEGGAMAIFINESASHFRAVIYPTRGEAVDLAKERLRVKGSASVTLDELEALTKAELAEPLFEATGSTFEEAISLLGKEVAEDAKAAGD